MSKKYRLIIEIFLTDWDRCQRIKKTLQFCQEKVRQSKKTGKKKGRAIEGMIIIRLFKIKSKVLTE